eukprot:CAMPEP_0195511714 /NCGR_PEP_ID=MMETSP0794_2-20130614/3938_1 /TAXON_ID=515487 /ORGANISM="Stephanopyxis turris, Strain CCMP 815" /LENGTH=709 /DNA_ID=CAMNT_0040639367 /DNA_START=40 /DNA_END=2169 /DNA_ORIENTATION=-
MRCSSTLGPLAPFALFILVTYSVDDISSAYAFSFVPHVNPINSKLRSTVSVAPHLGKTAQWMNSKDDTDVMTTSDLNFSEDGESEDKKAPNSKNNALELAVAMKEQAARARLEAERLEATLTLEKIISLEDKLIKIGKNSSNKKLEEREDIIKQIEILTNKVNPPNAALLKRSLPPSGNSLESNKSTSGVNTLSKRTPLSPEDVAVAAASFEKLPSRIQTLLAQAVGYYSGNLNSTDVVLKLYEQQDELLLDSSTWNKPKNTIKFISSDGKEVTGQEIFDLSDIMQDAEQGQLERFVESFFPSTTRKAGEAPTFEDAELFSREVLGNSAFNPTGKPEYIPGGFLIRGSNKMEDAKSMIDALDKSFEKSGSLKDKLSFYFVQDPTPDAMDDMENLFGVPVIVLFGKDLAPDRNSLLLTLVSLSSLGLMYFFSISAFADTQAVVQRLEDANAVANYDVEWFNALIFPLFGPILLTQCAHEAAHIGIAWRDKFKSSVPTLLPGFYMPFYGSVTSLKTPVKDVRSLFDFALAGPAVGIALSLALLFVGLQNTAVIDNASYSSLPSLSVGFLHLSSLGSGLVEGVLGDILQSADVAGAKIPLHPFAIAGYVGLIVNALNLLPIGSTDGGRISVAVFGRNGHILVQGLTMLILFGSSFFGADPQNLFLGYGIFAFFTQRELEIPCRNEIDDLDFARVVVAIATWVVVALTLVPVT